MLLLVPLVEQVQPYLLDELLVVGMFLSQIRDFLPQCFILPKGHNEFNNISINVFINKGKKTTPNFLVLLLELRVDPCIYFLKLRNLSYFCPHFEAVRPNMLPGLDTQLQILCESRDSLE